MKASAQHEKEVMQKTAKAVRKQKLGQFRLIQTKLTNRMQIPELQAQQPADGQLYNVEAEKNVGGVFDDEII